MTYVTALRCYSGGMTDQPDDPMLTVAEVATLTGVGASDFRARVRRGTAPRPDDPDEGRAPERRMPRWRLSTIRRWDETRQRGAGRPRRRPAEQGEASEAG